MGAPAYFIYACLSLLIAVFLTFGGGIVYNMDNTWIVMINRRNQCVI